MPPRYLSKMKEEQQEQKQVPHVGNMQQQEQIQNEVDKQQQTPQELEEEKIRSLLLDPRRLEQCSMTPREEKTVRKIDKYHSSVLGMDKQCPISGI